MTKKDFELIARLLRDYTDPSYREYLARRFAEGLAQTNPRFDRERFVKAVTERK